VHADIRAVNMPMSPLTVPTEAEIGLLLVAKYETDITIRARETRRRINSVRTLSAMAALVFAYDALSLVLGR
jgi:hypothetical protein